MVKGPPLSPLYAILLDLSAVISSLLQDCIVTFVLYNWLVEGLPFTVRAPQPEATATVPLAYELVVERAIAFLVEPLRSNGTMSSIKAISSKGGSRFGL